MTAIKILDPIPPGEILLEEFMKPLEISQNKLARDLDVPVARINDIIHAVAPCDLLWNLDRVLVELADAI